MQACYQENPPKFLTPLITLKMIDFIEIKIITIVPIFGGIRSKNKINLKSNAKT